jgi:hypothetical protein
VADDGHAVDENSDTRPSAPSSEEVDLGFARPLPPSCLRRMPRRRSMPTDDDPRWFAGC